MLDERTASGWSEVRVDVDAGGRFHDALVPLRPGLGARLDELAGGGAAVGARVPVQGRAAVWVRDALDRLERGRLVVLDYAATTAELAARPWTQWLRTYRGHERGVDPLEAPGTQDVTCEVAVDQLPACDRRVDQASWLAGHGLEELVEEGRRTWAARAGIGDLAALAARSRVREAEALTDPAGLGAFQVLEWVR
jgi:SAM-dependent MidA family methyltransferase